jgi:hypothetical protein
MWGFNNHFNDLFLYYIVTDKVRKINFVEGNINLKNYFFSINN